MNKNEKRQIEKIVEELLELAYVLQPEFDDNKVKLNNLAKQVVVVEIALVQLKIIFPFENRVEVWKKKKLEKLKELTQCTQKKN